ncbi:MAG TPA: TadG family pilus assembly protein [Acetobacteraceae bacterium]|nr:TadG family pilus assembly protein [Acetobacteraceae bacterium]
MPTWLGLRDRGSMGTLIAIGVIPGMIGFGCLSIDKGYYGYRSLLLKQTVEAAALAGGNKLTTYYTSNGSTATIVATAQAFTTANMPTAQYGTVVSAANVVLGNLSGTTFTSLASSRGTTPNAVQVTGVNSVPLFMGSWFGKNSVDVTATVIASSSTSQAFNTIVVNDMSDSFSSELSNQRAADLAILNCLKNQTGTTSEFGITLANGHSTAYQALAIASTKYSTLSSKISSLSSSSCGSNCGTGSNIASGMYSAIQQYSGSGFANTKKNIVIITDGVPNTDYAVDYEKADGIYPTATSTKATCIGKNKCSDANLLTMAKNQAAVAAAAGISISTIYYSGDTDPSDQASYAASLATLVTGTGVAMVAPSAAQITSNIGGFCATLPSALKLVL